MRYNGRLRLLRREARALDLGCGWAALADGLNHARPLLSAGEWMSARLCRVGIHAARRRLAACGSATMLSGGWLDIRSQYFTMHFPQQTKEHEHGQAR
jgi:hypothetical protein